MAKNDKKSSKKNAESRTDQVRAAVDQAFQAAGGQLTRDRAEQLADDLTSAAQRVRDALEDLRPTTTDDFNRLGDRLDAIEKRLSALETAPKSAPPRRAAPASPRKPPARKPAARKPASS